MTDLVSAIPGDLVVVDAASVLFRAHDGSRREIVNTADAAALHSCATFAPAGYHAERLSREYGWTPQQASALLSSLASRGLVMDAAGFLGARAAPPAPRVPEPLVVVRAYQRPDGLKVLLDSLLADEKRHGTRRRYAIVDDTPDAAHAAKTHALAAGFARATASSVHLLGIDQRGAALERALAPVPAASRAALAALLDPARPSAVTGSRTWNWAVLLSAGASLAILDDDTRFPLRELPGVRRPFDLLDATEPVVRWFDDDDALARALPESARDPYERLADDVGQPAGALLARDGWDARLLAHRSPRELLPATRNDPVIAAVPGTYGTITLDSSVYLTYPAESIADLWRAPYRHERLRCDRVAQGYEAPRLTSFASYTPLLADARELLPFAGTWGRVDDTYFLMLLRAMAPRAAYVHAPVLLGHADYGTRDRLARAACERIPHDRNAFVASLVRSTGDTLGGGDRASRLAAVGAAMAALATAGDAHLADLVLRWRAEMATRVTRLLDGALRTRSDAPPEWRAHAERVIAVNRAALAEDRVDPAELAHCRRAIGQLADAAPWWPAMWSHARDAGIGAFARRL